MSAERGPRTHRDIAYAPGAIIDRDTGVPLRVWGDGRLVRGVVADAALAETTARQLLAEQLATLAPRASIADFELVANVLSPKGDLRTVGFAQRAQGIRVLGGGIGFAFKADRLIMTSSTALPHVDVTVPTMKLPANVISNKVARWLQEAGFQARVANRVGFVASERVIVPIVRPRTGASPDIQYRVAEQVTAESVGEPGRWDVWVDAVDARPIARKSTIRYATGKVLIDAPDRWPGSTRAAKPAGFATHTVNGTAVTSTADGSVTWNGASAATVTLGLTGTYVAITNLSGPLATSSMSLSPNSTVTFTRASEEAADAQLSAFVFANTAKEFARTKVNPTLAWLNQPLRVFVNEDGSCNAYSTGDDIHFFKRSNQCENTARLADVVYHEFGHSLHSNSFIGVGEIDGALSEGMSDMYAALITRDAGMGRGFLFNNTAVRNLDNAKRWPDDVTGEVHADGEIIGAAMWHLGERLVTKLGATAGYEKTIDIYYGVLQRAADIPSSYAEALVADDDDGNLANGTPNQCEITAAFGRHGLADPTVTLGIQAPTRENFRISVTATPPSAGACPGASIQSAKLEWRTRGGTTAELPLVASGATYAADIPAQPEGSVVEYKVTVTLTDGSSLSYPKNAADPYYHFYVGPVTPIWCADFEGGFAGFTHGASQGSRDEWEVGSPMGLGGDPKVAHGGSKVLGLDLSRDGVYTDFTQTFAESPEIDLAGATAVRLQYYRWLGVEDAYYDKAKVLVNGLEVWKNFASPNDPQANGVSHQDREWRFHDVDLAGKAVDGKIKLRFELASDDDVAFAGWNLDDLCIVAATGPAVTCGNSAVDAGETCDDGNRVDGDGCNANCQSESDGDDSDDAGCCSVGDRPEGTAALMLVTLGLVLRRRRRRA
ncbi:MAG TPA: MYXO-CTERM sorting domain-containing protein [Kofleriaceae bacterium]|nr:MYXO-CTERM sorting domain-containing protein [Kofleriaceae bacterium]